MRYLVIPCYNETKRLQESEVLRCVTDLNAVVVLVNDGSTDGTLALLQKVSAIHIERIKILNLERNVGKGEAVRAGFIFAITQGATEIGFCDADFSVDYRDLSRIFAKLNENKSVYGVIGSRVEVAGSVIERANLKYFTGRAFATLVRLVLKQRIYDTQCGAKAFRVTPIVEKVFSTPFHSRWAFDVEIIGRINKLTNGENSTVIELPLMRWIEQPGSKLTFLSRIRTVFELIKIRKSLNKWRTRQESNLQPFDP